MDNPDVSDEKLSEYVDMDNWDNLPYEIKDAIRYFIWNDFKLEGTELLFTSRFMDDPNENPFKNIKPIKIKSINESEQSKKGKLFIPRNIDDRSVEFGKMVKGETNKFLIQNNIKSLKYIIKVDELWDDLEYDDIDNAFWNNTNCEVIFNNGEKWVNSYSWTKISHSDFIGYSHIMSAYLNKLINKHNPEDLVLDDLEIEVYCVVDSIKMDFIFTHQNREVVSFSKTI